mmetsp:Transcript_19039/g.67240  ORF Transcript_19039/g.67240 Transcript_19039/m.67240 type:complete len:206 (-) Transcript_19039:64-681(-)
MAVEGKAMELPPPVTGDEAVPPAGGLNDHVERVLYSERLIKERVAQIGAALSAELEGEVPLLVGVLTGAFVFVADLARAMTCATEVDFIAASSYGRATKSSGHVKIVKDLSADPTGRHIVICEDIVDSGLTLKALGEIMLARGAASVRFVVLFDKKERREHAIPNLAHTGFNCPDKFIVGYGIDYAQRYRNLPYVGVLKPEIYTT